MDDLGINGYFNYLATILGLILGVLGVMPGKLGPAISSTIIYIFRGMPLMVLAFFIYIGFPDLIGHGFKIPAFVAGMITLMLNEGPIPEPLLRGLCRGRRWSNGGGPFTRVAILDGYAQGYYAPRNSNHDSVVH
ncbi:hypothetical protein TUA1478L_03730 [Lactiplantibacillus plantarum]